MQLQIKNITKRYWRKTILENISVSFDASTITALVGSNGVGKTTLLKIILGLLKPNNGGVFFNDENISKLPTYKRIRKGLGYMSQQSSAITDLTVQDNLYLIPNLQKDDEEYRESLLEEFSLNDIRHQKVKTLSGGELQKLEFCLCMATRPNLILLDEPFAGLDPKTTKLVSGMIQAMHERGVGFVIIDHRIEELKGLASIYILLGDSYIIFNGEKKRFFINDIVKSKYLG